MWTDVAAFDRVETAKAVRALLEEEGIHARIHDERRLQRFWFLVTPHAGVQVEVPERDIAKVGRYFESSEGTRALLAEAIRCPACHSRRVQFPQMTRKFVLPTLVAQVLTLFGLLKHNYYCEDCHYTWQHREASGR